MANTKTFKGSFIGGELSPEMFGRIDDTKFQSGAASIENLIVTPLGPAEKRPGFAFVKTTKNNGPARLIPFTYSITQTMVIEIGPGYFRFHTQGKTLEYSATQPAFVPSGAVSYTIATPTVITWPGHPFSTGNSVVLAITGVAPVGHNVAYPAGLGYGPYNVLVLDANTFELTDPVTGLAAAVTAAPTYGGLAVEPNYAIGAMVSYGGATYYRPQVPPEACPFVPALDTDPATQSYWYALPADLTYEIPNTYGAADLMDIHFVQSADVMTLVHPNYPPSELRRYGATLWTFSAIVFGQSLSAPASVAIAPTLGYMAIISSIALALNPLITTVTDHSLALGDGVYVKGLTATLTGGGTRVLDGFWMVSKVPIDTGGHLITNELYLEDYSGNPLDASGWASYTYGATMQYGTQIVDITNTYVVTAVASDGIQQSATSTPVSMLNNLYVTGSYNTLSWAAVAGAYTYYVYKLKNGLYGFIGQTPKLTFSDTNIGVDMAITPDIYDPVFGAALDYPGAVSYYQQRRIFAGTNNNPQNLWMTKTGTESDMSYSLPVRDTDRIAIAIATREMSTILHVVPLLQLVLLTNSCEISASPSNSDAITPSTICARPQSYIGATNVAPTIVNNQMLFCAARGGHVREMGYQWQIGGYVTGDVSLRAAHLFDGFSIVDQAFMKAAWQVVWFVSSSGNLLGFTYIPEESVGAWHHHVTDGIFQSVAVVAEGQEDHLYAVITRQINGQAANCIERMGSRLYGGPESAFFVDCGATFDGTNTTATTMMISGGPLWDPSNTLMLVASAPIFVSTDVGSVLVFTGADGVTLYRFTVKIYVEALSVTGVIDKVLEADLQNTMTAKWAWARPIIEGLTWLVGETVNVLVDGAVETQCVVQPDGSIALQRPGVVVQVGLPYTAEIDTLPIALQQVPGVGQGTQKNINKLWIKLFLSGSVFAGPKDGNLTEYKQRTVAAYGTPPDLMTREIELAIPPSWNPDGMITISQSNPLPLTVVGITTEVSVGG